MKDEYGLNQPPPKEKGMKRRNKLRLDSLLVEQGFFSAREKAKAAIMAGEVLVDGVIVDKAGTQISAEAVLEVKAPKLPYVSRGGLKLARAFEVFGLDFRGRVVLDIGSSTGGFVDCALQNGAARIYAVDVGYGQLAWKLRQDSRVVVWEKTNARYLTREHIPEQVDWITADVSFISLGKALSAAVEFLKPQGQVLALVKPQFEAGPEHVGKKGVVRDKEVHKQVLAQVMEDFEALGLYACGISFSPITGPEGNIEYLLWATVEKQAKAGEDFAALIEATVTGGWDFHKPKA